MYGIQPFMKKAVSWLPFAAIAVSVLILAGFAAGNTAIVWFLTAVNFIAGPACLFFYLLEVKKGIFRHQPEEEDG